jgi:hypothetical protein
MAVCIIKIAAAAFGAGQPLDGVPPNKARIPIGSGIQGSGAFAGGKELRNIGYHNPAAIIATATGYQFEDESFLNGMPYDGVRAPLADMVNRGIIEVLKAGVAATVADILAGTV